MQKKEEVNPRIIKLLCEKETEHRMNILLIVTFIIWIYVLTVLKRGKLEFWYFIAGSVGLFIYMLILVEPVILAPLQKAVSAVAGMFGDMTGIYESYFNKNVIFISTGDTNLSMYIDYECSGIIEILAFLALLWFFPLYHMSVWIKLISALSYPRYLCIHPIR